MNPFELLQSLLMPSPEGPGRFAQPDLMQPPQPEPKSWNPSDAVKDAAPTVFLRNLLLGGGAKPPSNPDPEGAAIAASMPQQASPPPGVALGRMPAGSSSPDLRAMFAGGEQQTSAGQMPPRQPMPMQSPAPRPAPQPVSAPSAVAPAQAASQGGLADLLSGLQKNPTAMALRDILGSAMAGAATAQGPRAGNIGAFGTGYTTAQKASDARSQAEAARLKAMLDQTLAIRKDTREERGANRSDSELGIKQGDATRRDKEYGLKERDQARKDEESKVRNQVAVEKLMRVRDGQLPVDAKFKLTDQLLRYADKINKNGLMQPAELDAALRKEQGRLETYYGVKSGDPQQQGAAAPVTQQARGPDGKVVTFELRNGQWVPQQ